MVGKNITGHQLHRKIAALGMRNVSILQADQMIQLILLQNTKLLVKIFVKNSDMITLFSHLDRIEDSKIFNLVVTDSIDKSEGFLLLIGFNTSHEMQICIFGHFFD